jgi:hypothetical protein
MRVLLRHFSLMLFAAVLCFVSPDPSPGAESAPTLTIKQPSTNLYSRQDEYSDVIAQLKSGEAVTPLAEAVGIQSWYLVQTKQGLTGWLRAADVSITEKEREIFREPPKEENLSGSVWSAQDDKGRTFRGTWTVEQSSFTDKAAGTWTLDTGKGTPAVHGLWSAQKFSTGWSGTWRALIDSQKTDYSGSWTADFPKSRETRFGELFEAAAREAIRGVWSAGVGSGSWSIRAGR